MATELRQFKEGDEVWVKAVVTKPGETTTGVRLWAHDLGFVNNDYRVRAEADFKDPLDEAVVQSAVALIETTATGATYRRLRENLEDAVQAKLDAARPHPAERIVMETLNADVIKSPNVDDMRQAIASDIVTALDAAGLLREESE